MDKLCAYESLIGFNRLVVSQCWLYQILVKMITVYDNVQWLTSLLLIFDLSYTEQKCKKHFHPI